MTQARWIDDVRAAGPATIAKALGLRVHRSPSGWGIGPCPACGAERRHRKSSDRRVAIGAGLGAPGWSCFQCGASGDAVDLVAHVEAGARYRDLDDDGRAAVRGWCRRWLGEDIEGPQMAVARPRVTPEPEPEPKPSYPDAGEVAALWGGAERVDADSDVSAYLRGRGLCPGLVADAELARTLRPDQHLPGWARAGRESWLDSDHRLLVQLYDAAGAVQSVLARSIAPSAERKSLAPRGHSRRGLVMADPLAVLLLQHGTRPEWWPDDEPLTVVVAEGEVDFLAWICTWSQGVEYAPAVFGAVQGSWSEEVAARIPDGADVVLAADDDQAGDEHADRVARSLAGRDVQVRRWRPSREAA